MKSTEVLKSIMGEELYEALNKALVKLGTKSVVDLAELHSAMKTAPKSVIAFLMREVHPMSKDETKEVKIPWDDTAKMTITKLDSDVYKGLIFKDGKIIHEFDLTAIPQLAAHIMSSFEIYDEDEHQETAKEESSVKEQENESELRQQIKMLDDKINALMMLVASQSPIQKNENWTKDIGKIAKSNYDAMIKPDLRKKFIESVKGLKKTGQMPKMPGPPKAGTKVGGNQGLTQAGIHGDKTTHTDLSSKPHTQQNANPFLSAPKTSTPQAKQPKSPKLASSEKTMTVQKSELSHKCDDCGQAVGSCACFKALSRPEIKKSEGQSVTFKFNGDWDQESIQALYKSIKRIRE